MPGEISAGRAQAAWGPLSERQCRCIFNCNRSRDTTASPVAKPADHRRSKELSICGFAQSNT